MEVLNIVPGAVPHKGYTGPAYFLYSGATVWYKNYDWHKGLKCCHREDGPASIHNDEKYYYLEGIHYSKAEWFERLTPEQKMIALWNPENW